MNKVPIIKKNTVKGKKLPEAVFIENVTSFVNKHGMEKVQNGLNDAYNKFKLTEAQFTKFKGTAKDKIPEIKRSIDLIDHLKKNNDIAIQTKFQLTDGIYAYGEIAEKNDRVGLWLGADLMVEYTLDEAEVMLKDNLEKAHQNISTYNKDLSFLKEQITICEVNIARVHNFKVTIDQQNAKMQNKKKS